MKIVEGNHLNMKALIIETDKIRIKILPKLGFKVASIYHKKKDREILNQPRDGEYRLPNLKNLAEDRWVRYDDSGLNDMIPTYKPCLYPPDENFKDLKLPDGGDVWGRPWKVKVEDEKIIGEIDLVSLPLTMKKSIRLVDETSLEMDYEVRNNSDKDLYYLWNLQGLYNCDDNVDFIFQEDMNFKINVLTHEDLSRFNTDKIAEYRDDRAYRYFFYGDLKTGLVGLDYKEDRFKYLIEYDTKKLPYLGVYVNKRKGRCSVYPSNSFFDSVIVAYDNNTIHKIKAEGLDKWTVKLSIEDY